MTGSAAAQGMLWGAHPNDWAEHGEAWTEPLFKDVLEALEVRKGTRLLDAGCGAGAAAVLAAQRGASLTGLDASAALLEVARRRVPRARFDAGDIQSLPYADGEFEAVMAINSIFYCADLAASMAELARVAAPGAKIAVTAWGKPADCQMASVFGAIAGALPQKPPGAGPFALSAPGALEGLLEQAALRPSLVGSTRCDFTAANWESLWKGMAAAGPVQGAIRAVGEERIQTVLRAAVEPFLRDGAFTLQNSFLWAVGEKR